MNHIKYIIFCSLLSTIGMSVENTEKRNEDPICSILIQETKKTVQEKCKKEADYYKYCLATNESLLPDPYETVEAEISLHICLMNNNLIEPLTQHACEWSEQDFI